jgi:hypothetical protein
MPKISHRPLIRLPCIRIWRDDYQYLRQLSDDTEMDFAALVREVLAEYVKTVRTQANEAIDQQLAPLDNLLKLEVDIGESTP